MWTTTKGEEEMSEKKKITLLIEISDMEHPTDSYSISAPEEDMPDDEEMFILLMELAKDIKGDLGVDH